jgi:hypothetical protein
MESIIFAADIRGYTRKTKKADTTIREHLRTSAVHVLFTGHARENLIPHRHNKEKILDETHNRTPRQTYRLGRHPLPVSYWFRRHGVRV